MNSHDQPQTQLFQPRLHKFSWLLRVAICLAAACGVLSEAGANEPEVQKDLARIGMAIARQHCGSKATRSKQQVKNRFEENVLDQRETIRCNGLVLTVYHANIHRPPHLIYEWLTLSSPHPKLPKLLSPGATRENVLTYAGKPTQADPTTIEYLLNDEGPDRQTATFKFTGNTLTSITWRWSWL